MAIGITDWSGAFFLIKQQQKRKKLKPKQNAKLERFCLYGEKVAPKAGSVQGTLKGLVLPRMVWWDLGRAGGAGTRLMWIVPRTSSCR